MASNKAEPAQPLISGTSGPLLAAAEWKDLCEMYSVASQVWKEKIAVTANCTSFYVLREMWAGKKKKITSLCQFIPGQWKPGRGDTIFNW